jgi:hypothetical protein
MRQDLHAEPVPAWRFSALVIDLDDCRGPLNRHAEVIKNSYVIRLLENVGRFDPRLSYAYRADVGLICPASGPLR